MNADQLHCLMVAGAMVQMVAEELWPDAELSPRPPQPCNLVLLESGSDWACIVWNTPDFDEMILLA